ncbi:MAG: hypothetical protein ACKOE4_08225, partial [Candidatus Kapaibacterium sp.]
MSRYRSNCFTVLVALAMLVPAMYVVNAQPLANPYRFAIDHEVDLDTSLIGLPMEPAGAKGRVVLTSDGHLDLPTAAACALLVQRFNGSRSFPTVLTPSLL